MATINIVMLNKDSENNIYDNKYLRSVSSKLVYANAHLHGFSTILNQVMGTLKISGLEKVYFVFSDGTVKKSNRVKDGENNRDFKYISDDDNSYLVLIPCEWEYTIFKSGPKVYLSESIIRI